MDETVRSEVERILRKYDDNKEEERKKWEETKQEMERFDNEYDRIKREVIRPTMDEVQSVIKKLGHNCQIIEPDKDKIGIEVNPRSSMERTPRILFGGSSTEVTISKYPLFPSLGSYQRVKVEEITKRFVEENILDVLKTWERSGYKG